MFTFSVVTTSTKHKVQIPQRLKACACQSASSGPPTHLPPQTPKAGVGQPQILQSPRKVDLLNKGTTKRQKSKANKGDEKKLPPFLFSFFPYFLRFSEAHEYWWRVLSFQGKAWDLGKTQSGMDRCEDGGSHVWFGQVAHTKARHGISVSSYLQCQILRRLSCFPSFCHVVISCHASKVKLLEPHSHFSLLLSFFWYNSIF